MLAAACLLKSLLSGAKAKPAAKSSCSEKSCCKPENTQSSDAAVQAHVDAVAKRYSYMIGHVEEEYFSDAGLALKIQPNAVVVDVGAHFGLFSMQCYIRSGFTSKHYCFEPIPQIRSKLEHTVAGLDPTGNNIKVFPYGLSDKEGSIEFTYVGASPELSGYKDVDFEREVNLATSTIIERYYDDECPEYFRAIMPPWFGKLPYIIGAPILAVIYNLVMLTRDKTELVHCELKRCSDVLAPEKLEVIDILKIDVEGAELDVMRGISKEDWAKVKVAVIEVHDKDGHLALVRDILKENGLTQIEEAQDLITKPLLIWQIIAKRA